MYCIMTCLQRLIYVLTQLVFLFIAALIHLFLSLLYSQKKVMLQSMVETETLVSGGMGIMLTRCSWRWRPKSQFLVKVWVQVRDQRLRSCWRHSSFYYTWYVECAVNGIQLFPSPLSVYLKEKREQQQQILMQFYADHTHLIEMETLLLPLLTDASTEEESSDVQL